MVHLQDPLAPLGWREFFSRQLTPEELPRSFPARVCTVHRSALDVLCEYGQRRVVLRRGVGAAGALVTAGDWVLIEREAPRVRRVLDRYSSIVRLAAGGEVRAQAVAANLDVLFVVTSCNQDFNPSRLERYLSLAYEGGVEPVIVLTKMDLCDDAGEYLHRAQALASRAAAVAVNATSGATLEALRSWLGKGRTAAFAGSSGVGKSTLINSLLGRAQQATRGIREDDDKGRHTTTARELLALPDGGWVIDTPGMRELKIGACAGGVHETFDDLTALASQCRFRDCRHQDEIGCALRLAVTDGRLEARRLTSYLKLLQEAAHAKRTLHARRQDERRLGKLYKRIQDRRRRERRGD